MSLNHKTNPKKTSSSLRSCEAPKEFSCGRRRLATVLCLLLSGGSLFGACEMSFRDAFLANSRNILFSLLDPAAIVDGILGTPATAENDLDGL